MNTPVGLQFNDISSDELQSLIDLAYSLTGIALTVNKKELITARLRRRLRALNLDTFRDYLSFLRSTDGADEIKEFMDAITTNTTQFFRESHHFDTLVELVLQEMHSLNQHRSDQTIKIWSAGCSSGNEAYTLGMVLADYFHGDLNRFHIIGTDISRKMLQKAQLGVFESDEVDSFVPPLMKQRYFLKGKGLQEGRYRVVPELRARISFRYFNLISDVLHKDEVGMFDIIFCRNVIIYFDAQTRVDLIERFYRCLAPGGYLFIGHSETLTGISRDFTLVKPTIYRKPVEAMPGRR